MIKGVTKKEREEFRLPVVANSPSPDGSSVEKDLSLLGFRGVQLSMQRYHSGATFGKLIISTLLAAPAKVALIEGDA